MVFKPKIDWWFHALAVLLCFVTLFLVYWAVAGREPVLFVVTGLFTLILAVLIVPMWIHTRYTLSEVCLTITSGLLTSRIQYKDILGVKESRNSGAAPAPSMDRVQIQYRTQDGDSNFTAISPKEKAEFIRQIRLKL